jgi:transposase-like protein
LELLAENGLEDLREPMTILLNAAMKIERERHLGAAPWQRSPTRAGHANGFKDKTLKTRVGELALRVPQTRAGDFYPSALERGERSERALKLALAEMYVQGVSTRKVSAVVEQLCGFEVSSTQVSRAAATLDESLEQWRTGALPACPYVVLDARYEKVRQGGQVIDCAVLLAIGVTEQGRRRVLGVSVALSEAEAHWRGFLKSLQERGLHGVKLFIADDHAGLKAARRAVFPAVPWQRCQFHLQRNAQAYVPKQDMRAAVAQTLRAIFTAPEREEAERLLKLAITKFEKTAPKLATWMEENLHEGLTVFAFDPAHRVRLRTSNMLERLNKEIKRRTRVATLFPNEKSLLRLVTAVVGEIDDEWTTGKIYLGMKS